VSSGEGVVYSLVIPVYNEEAVVPLLLHRLDRILERLDGPAEVIFVDDGSRDTSAIVLAARAAEDPRYRLISLSRNFGHQIAITAGMDAAAGQAVIVMDADLQDPPEVVHDLVARWREGFEIVHAQRLSREGETRFKTWTASAFYRILRKLASVDIPENVGDFRLIDRKALDTFRAMPERDRFVRGMFAWMGYRQTVVPFHRHARAAGSTKYPLLKMLRLAANGVVGFSDMPLRIALWAGGLVSVASLVYGLAVLVMALTGVHLVSGWASIIVVVSFLSGLNMMLLGVIGLYVGRIHAEVKDRPLYVIGRKVGFDRAVAAGAVPARRAS
jgi:glycosyltransferase involved in cell wall biosynthesis